MKTLCRHPELAHRPGGEAKGHTANLLSQAWGRGQWPERMLMTLGSPSNGNNKLAHLPHATEDITKKPYCMDLSESNSVLIHMKTIKQIGNEDLSLPFICNFAVSITSRSFRNILASSQTAWGA